MSEPRVEFGEGPLRIGSIFLSKYRIVSVLGQGGHAWVYLAHELLSRRDVAIKVVYRLGGVSEEMLERGQREVQILSQVEHRNIVRLYSADLTKGVLSIVMEYLPGRSIRDVLAQHGRLEMEEMLDIVAQAADALHAAHMRGVIHRDVKPENAFICDGNIVKMIDFGVAKVLNASVLTLPDALVGTIYYMSPQQFQGQDASPAMDIYALAVVFYEGLAGRHPIIQMIEKPNPTVWDVGRLIVMKNPKLLNELDPRITRYVAALAAKGMSKKENQRHSSALEFAAEARYCRELVLADLARQGRAPTDRDLARGGLPSSGVKETLRSTQPVPSMMTGLLASAEPPERIQPAAAAPDQQPGISPLPAQKTAPLGSSRLYLDSLVDANSEHDTAPELSATAGLKDHPRPVETAESVERHHAESSSAGPVVNETPPPFAESSPRIEPPPVRPLASRNESPSALPSEVSPQHAMAPAAAPAISATPPVISATPPAAGRLRSLAAHRLHVSRPVGILLALVLGSELGIALGRIPARTHLQAAAHDDAISQPMVTPTNVPIAPSALQAPEPDADPVATVAAAPPSVAPPSETTAATAAKAPATLSSPRLPKRVIRPTSEQAKKVMPATSASAASPSRQPAAAPGALSVSSGLDGPPIAPLQPEARPRVRAWFVPQD